MKYELVCFDLDGTLVDTFPYIIESYKEVVINKYGKIEENLKDITSQIGMPIKYFFANYPKEDRLSLQEAFSVCNDKKQSKGVPFFSGVKQMLYDLKKIVKIGIVTSRRNIRLNDWLEKENMQDLFDVVVGRNDTLLHKPNGEPLIFAMEKLGIAKEKTLYVGDAFFDVMCARNSGAKSCLVGWTALSKEEIDELNPDYVIKNTSQIFDIIK